MPKPRRNLLATAEETTTPPATLPATQSIARVIVAAGKSLYHVEVASAEKLLVELPARFRNAIWIKKGGYVVVDVSMRDERENKIGGEIVNVVRNEKEWRRREYWPVEFKQKITYLSDSDEEESTVGKMPPQDLDDE
ncbi:hypothetical protein AAFC00_006986 [Neodothiora populina]|uniref:S1-like domain-containing protein n=1 Tax=Neodothiora populina TaxID=2781224 RepID=A0ABR3PBV1_9PEZI